MVASLITRGLLGLIAPTLLLVGCLDVRQVDASGTDLDWPRLRVVDDFEADWPTWNLLGPWSCAAYGGGTGECDWTEGANASGRAWSLSFDLLGEGESDYANASLTTRRRAITLDLSAFEDLVFNLKLDPPVDAEPLPEDFLVRVSLSCPAAAVEGVSPDGEPVGIYKAVAPPADGRWHPYALSLNFIRKSWQPTRDLDPEHCLTLVDSLSFEVAIDNPHVHFAGTIAVDDVAFEDFEGTARAVPEASRYAPWYCGTTPDPDTICTLDGHTPTLNLAPEGTSGLCTSPVRVDDNQELIADTRSLAAFKSLSLSARVVNTQPGGTPIPFNVTVGCEGFQSRASVSHSIDVFSEWSTYRLDLEGFKPFNRPDVTSAEGCLAQLESICVETDFAGETYSGTLEVDDWVLR